MRSRFIVIELLANDLDPTSVAPERRPGQCGISDRRCCSSMTLDYKFSQRKMPRHKTGQSKMLGFNGQSDLSVGSIRISSRVSLQSLSPAVASMNPAGRFLT